MAAIDQIRKIIVDELAVEESEVVEEANFTDDLDADSMNLLVIYSEVEKAFNIKIDDNTALGIRTVGDLIKIIGD
jgi:acyl carrier protein